MNPNDMRVVIGDIPPTGESSISMPCRGEERDIEREREQRREKESNRDLNHFARWTPVGKPAFV